MTHTLHEPPSTEEASHRRPAWMGLLLLASLLGACSPSGIPSSSTLTPTPPARADLRVPGLVMLVDANLTAPLLPPNPSLADLGAEPYFQICLACHDDWGQGLTDEWRATWGEDENCWQSKCHASNHPPWGFELPRSIPPLLGAGSLSRYQTADELYQQILQSMPWWNPGSLSEDQAWALTAYLLRARGELPTDFDLNPGSATVLTLHTPVESPPEYRSGALLLVGALLITALAVRREAAL